MSEIETISFDAGINRKKSPLLLRSGELHTCSGFNFAHDGVSECRAAKTQSNAIDTDTDNTVNGIFRDATSLFASVKSYCEGGPITF